MLLVTLLIPLLTRCEKVLIAATAPDMEDVTVKQALHFNCVKEFKLSNTCSSQPLTVSDLKDVMNIKTCDLDPLPTNLILRCLHVLWVPFLDIVNLSLATGVVPHVLKNTRVVQYHCLNVSPWIGTLWEIRCEQPLLCF